MAKLAQIALAGEHQSDSPARELLMGAAHAVTATAVGKAELVSGLERKARLAAEALVQRLTTALTSHADSSQAVLKQHNELRQLVAKEREEWAAERVILIGRLETNEERVILVGREYATASIQWKYRRQKLLAKQSAKLALLEQKWETTAAKAVAVAAATAVHASEEVVRNAVGTALDMAGDTSPQRNRVAASRAAHVSIRLDEFGSTAATSAGSDTLPPVQIPGAYVEEIQMLLAEVARLQTELATQITTAPPILVQTPSDAGSPEAHESVRGVIAEPEGLAVLVEREGFSPPNLLGGLEPEPTRDAESARVDAERAARAFSFHAKPTLATHGLKHRRTV